MKKPLFPLEIWVSGIAGVALALAGTLLLVQWLHREPDVPIEMRRPFMDGTSPSPHAVRDVPQGVNIEGELFTFDGTPSDHPGSWPGFRGPDRNNIARLDKGLPPAWPAGGPPVLWSVELGEGYAGPAIHKGRVYLLDYDGEKGGDALRCFSLRDGKEIWRRWYRVQIKRNHGMSRTVPAVNDRVVVSIGPKCQVLCAEADTGTFKWGYDLVSEFGTKVPLWYTGQCPLIDGPLAILAPAGRDSLLIAVELDTGKVVWKTPNPHGWNMSHSSVVKATLAGRPVYVYAAIGGITGVAADGPEAGTILWQTDAWNHSVISPSPVPVGATRLFLSAGYGGGSGLLEINQKGEGYEARLIQTIDRTVFGCEQQTPIYVDGLLYTVMPSDGGALKRQFVCAHPDGSLVWASGKAERFGLGPFLRINDSFLIMNDHGELSVIDGTAGTFKLQTRHQVLEGKESWGPMAVVEGRLLVRDFTRMVCLDISQN